MANCQKCQNPTKDNRSAVIRGVYYENVCKACATGASQVSRGHAAYNRSRDLEEHEADIIQPYAGGKPSKEFIHLYPEQAKRMFTASEMDKATRS